MGLEELQLADQETGAKWTRAFIKINLRITKARGEGSTYHHAPPTEEGRMLAAPCATLTFFSDIVNRSTQNHSINCVEIDL